MSPANGPLLPARTLDRRSLLSGSAAAAGSLALAACGIAPPSRPEPTPSERALLDRPIVDVHAHIFVASDLPGYQFIVQSFLADEDPDDKPPSKALLTVLHAFADTVSECAPNFKAEMDFLTHNQRWKEWTLKETLAKTFERIGKGEYRSREVAPCMITEPSPRESKETFDRLRSALAPQATSIDDASQRIALYISRAFESQGMLAHVATRLAAIVEGRSPLLENALEWLRGFMKSRLERVDDWAKFMSGNQADAPRFVMPAMVDFGYALARQDQPRTHFDQQVDLMAIISRRQPSHRVVHGYVPFNPWRWVLQGERERRDSLALIKHAVNDCGFIGVKLYPPMGFQASGNTPVQHEQFKLGIDDPNCGITREFPKRIDEELWALYAYCEKYDVPIMLHSAPSNEAKGDWGHRVDPQFWWSILEKHPKLRVNFGHFGGGFSLKKKPDGKHYMKSIVALMARFPNVYADLSDYSLVLDAPAERTAKALLTEELNRWTKVYGNKLLRDRLMFGTDWTFIARVPEHQAYPRALLLYMADNLGGDSSGLMMNSPRRDELITSFAAGNAGRFIGFNDPRGQVLSRLLRFYGKDYPEHVATLTSFVDVARGPRQVAMRG